LYLSVMEISKVRTQVRPSSILVAFW